MSIGRNPVNNRFDSTPISSIAPTAESRSHGTEPRSSILHALRTNAFRLNGGIVASMILAFLSLSILGGCTEGNDSDGASADSTAHAEQTIDTAGLPTFSGESAYNFVDAQVAIGPRNPNSPGAAKAIEYYQTELSKYTESVSLQKFEHTGYEGEKLNLTNVIASFNPDAGTRILLCAHWDSRPRADHDTKDQDKPILAANDGASGVGVLMEMARIMHDNPPPIGVDIVLFDGEDYGDTHIDDVEQYFLGARYFSANLPEGYHPYFGILLDMVGDHNAEFRKEGYSMTYAPEFVNALWAAARKMGLSTFSVRRGDPIQDDHLILNKEGKIPTLDIIDGDLVGHKSPDPRRKYWHTHNDTMENISSTTLEQVGRLLVYTVYKWVPSMSRPA